MPIKSVSMSIKFLFIKSLNNNFFKSKTALHLQYNIPFLDILLIAYLT